MISTYNDLNVGGLIVAHCFYAKHWRCNIMINDKDNKLYNEVYVWVNRIEYIEYEQEITRILKNMYDWENYYKLLTDKEGENNDS